MEEHEIFNTFVQILNWASERNKNSKSYGTDDKLYIAEIQTLVMIGKMPGILQKELCKEVGVTKGRMSVIIAHLQEKNLIEMRREQGNGCTIPIYLTTLGEQIYHNHNEQEMNMKIQIYQVLSKCSQEEIEKFNGILRDILEILRQ
ncbi:MarR family winged helix-turn-helix transcriptional regulator [Clostridioides difficile]|nr:MarR family winged helix-turn-helix transcriptional regulator [Clostridioides difficile]